MKLREPEIWGNENHLKYYLNGIRISCFASDNNAINYGENLLIVSDAAAANVC